MSQSRKQPGAISTLWKTKILPFYKQKLRPFIVRHKVPCAIGAAVFLVGLLVLLIALFAHKSPNPKPDPSPTPTVTPTATPTPTPTPAPTPFTAVNPNPLTGLELLDPAHKTTRPLAITHNNEGFGNAMRDLSGASEADILYEFPIEDGITRLLGVYQEYADLPRLGWVRSARTYHLETALAYDAILAHCGDSYIARKQFEPWNVDHIDLMKVDGDHFWSDKFTGGKLVADLATKRNFVRDRDTAHTANGPVFVPPGTYSGVLPPPTEAAFAQLPSGAPAEEVTVQVNYGKKTTFKYDPVAGLYAVWQFDAPMTDGRPRVNTTASPAPSEEDTRVPVTVANVVVLQTSVTTMNDEDGHQVIDLQSGGKGWLLTEGIKFPLRWSRDGLPGVFTYQTGEGAPLAFTAGKTYVAVCDTEKGIIAPKASTPPA